MAKTLLNAVNQILQKVGSTVDDVSSLTDTGRKRDINLAVQVWNEATDLVYAAAKAPVPKEQAESTITLVASQRDYTLASDLVQLRWPLIDKTNAQYIHKHGGDYNDILVEDPEQDDDGLAISAVISPVDSKLYLSKLPTATEAGRVYTYQYDKDLELTAAADEVPFSNAVFRAMVNVSAQLWKAEKNNVFNEVFFKTSIGHAARLLTQAQPREDYSPR